MKDTFKPGDLIWVKEYGSWWRGKVVLLDGPRHAFVVESYDTRARRVPFRLLRHRSEV